MGTVVGAVVIFVSLAFGGHPHDLVLAVLTTMVFLVVASAFDLYLHRLAKRRTPPPNEDERRSFGHHQ